MANTSQRDRFIKAFGEIRGNKLYEEFRTGGGIATRRGKIRDDQITAALKFVHPQGNGYQSGRENIKAMPVLAQLFANDERLGRDVKEAILKEFRNKDGILANARS